MKNFYKIRHQKRDKPERIEVYPDFQTGLVDNLMVRGGSFYAIWDPETDLWSTDEFDVVRLVDDDLYAYADEIGLAKAIVTQVKSLADFDSGRWTKYKNWLTRHPDNYNQLDERLTFANTEIRKSDYVSKRLPYPLEAGSTEAFDVLFSTLYDKENFEKIMWAIGSVVAGDSIRIQKFYVLFGPPGSGKSTVLNLIANLFDGYTTPFEVGAMTTVNNTFAAEVFKNNPLVAIDHEGDLARIRNNSMLTNVISHDTISINVKYQHPYPMRLGTTLFIATNKPVMITDKGSGVIRRLIDIRPTGAVVSITDYEILIAQMDFELGAIAQKCLSFYKSKGPHRYDRYKPLDMMHRTNVFFNFVDEYQLDLTRDGWITLSRAWEMYKDFCESFGITERMPRHAFRDELKTYFKEFFPITRIDGKQIRSVYKTFDFSTLSDEVSIVENLKVDDWLEFKENNSILDKELRDQPAQLANESGTPSYSWDNVTTIVSEIDTSTLHYILPPSNLITIDFDIKDENGEKSLELNKEAAKNFPQTYGEVSKSGKGIHLHYYYDGDVERLLRLYSPGIEILRPVGLFSIRRQLSLCNEREIATINSGLPIKEKVDVISKKTLSNEKSLRDLILRNLKKEIQPATKPSIDFIHKILEDAYTDGLRYDVTDMRPYILEFASNSTNNAGYCIQKALDMQYKSDHEEEESEIELKDAQLVFYDIEVFPNLLLICWKYAESDTVVRMKNPEPTEIEELLNMPLVGFNCRRYDNHILYARYLGYSLENIYNISKRIITGDRSAYFREAYALSHADVYDFATEKKSLKHWQVDLGIFHNEIEINWDEPLPEKLYDTIAQYCENDVRSTEAVFNARLADYRAREILADLSGLKVNNTTMSHTSKIVFQNNRNHKADFIYPDLSEEFPGYTFDAGKSIYKDEQVGEGGYVWAQPGMYNNVLYMDIASMHPTSLEIMNLFGNYTKRYSDLKTARLLIKEGNLEKAGKMFGGRLAKHLKETDVEALSYALKIALNIVYGFTAASFDNPFRDNRNKDNVVAKRGALFMVDLKRALLDRGSKPIHFKTDSVKIADYTESDIQFVKEFGLKYGYTFEVEEIYNKLVLINDAVLVGRINIDEDLRSSIWDVVGARFAKPYVYKSLFSKEPLEFEDFIETRSVVKGEMYIDFDGDMEFIGRIGMFCPMKTEGGLLYRVIDDKQYAVTGTKGYRWLQAHIVKANSLEDDIDVSYFEEQTEDALSKISAFGDPTIFLEN
jgi:DNA polymerase elongation subunit (family B)/energy-coupling factor transporter ATP-binding protein EcfA2